LFILPFLVAALPARIAERVPGVRLVTALAGAFSPGRLAPLVWRILPQGLRESMALLSGRRTKHQQLYAGVQKWALLRWSQLFAVSFQVTALIACLMLIVFTDLAFGWSTTLTTGDATLDAQRVHRVTSAIAAPWVWAVDDAQPSLELIKESRYFRVTAEPVSTAQAARLGGWWKFIVLTIAVYGLLPRVITLALAQAQFRAAARAAVVEAPGLSAVLRRIHRAQLESAAVEPEAAGGGTMTSGNAVDSPLRSIDSIRAVINWADVPVSSDLLVSLSPGAKVYQAGGTVALSDDVALAKQIASTTGTADSAVLIVVKAWEPPLMEFIDFLNTIRSVLPRRSCMIIVLPVGLDDSASPAAHAGALTSRTQSERPLSSIGSMNAALPEATPAQLKLWRDKLGSLGDPWLRVASNGMEV